MAVDHVWNEEKVGVFFTGMIRYKISFFSIFTMQACTYVIKLHHSNKQVTMLLK